MKKAAFIILAIAILCSAALADDYDDIDRSGYDVIEADRDYETSTYTDQFGNTSGTIDGKDVSLHTDDQGYTTGNIGKKHVYCYTDDFGNTTCN